MEPSPQTPEIPLDEQTSIHVLVVEDEPDLRSALRYNLKKAGYRVSDACDGRAALELIDRLRRDGEAPIELVVSDVMMPVMNGIDLCRALRARPGHAETPLLFLTARGHAADRVEGFRVGADDYLTKPFDLEELLARVQVHARRALVARQMRRLLGEPSLDEGPRPVTEGGPHEGDLYAKVATWERRFPGLAAIRRDSIVGQSPKMLALLREVLMRAPGRDPVLIVGATGSGKTGIAEALHRLGPRSERPFRVVSCAELAAADAAITLGKLFGYGRGSGLPNVPKDGQPGLLEDLDGGTLFLDEIHRLPEQAQSMLLLPVEGRPFQPAVGKGDARQVDVKFLFATNVDLQLEADDGRFAFDLYQRLSASQIHVPRLEDRREDIPALVLHFLDECRGEFGFDDASIAPSLMRHLVERAWPGNVRELRSLVRELTRRAAFELDTLLTLEHLPQLPQATARSVSSTPAPPMGGLDPVRPVDNDGVDDDDDPPPSTSLVPGERDDGNGLWHEAEVEELAALRRARFKIAAAEQALGLSSKSRTLTNHLRGICFKALVHAELDLQQAARLVVGREDDALLDRTAERMAGYLDMVRQHVASHTTRTLFNNLPRDYRKYVETVIERERA